MFKVMTVAKAALVAAPFAFASLTAQAADTIVDKAAGSDQFDTLVQAVQAAGLVDVLSGEGPFTVFAPTDEAFAQLPEGTLENLLKPENIEQLRAILTYHVVPGKIMASDVVGKMAEVGTVEGSQLSVDATGQGVQVAEANVVSADIEASNGVIHAIDTVLIPKD